jgi:hypothetical protein
MAALTPPFRRWGGFNADSDAQGQFYRGMLRQGARLTRFLGPDLRDDFKRVLSLHSQPGDFAQEGRGIEHPGASLPELKRVTPRPSFWTTTWRFWRWIG